MPTIATGSAFHKASRTIVRAVEPSSPRAFVSTFDSNGFIIPPPLGPKEYYIEMQGISQLSVQFDDNVQDIRTLADSGWGDGTVISSKVTVSVTSYFMRDLQYIEGWAPGTRALVPAMPAWNNGAIACTLPDRTIGAWERGFSLIAKARYEKDIGRIASDPTIRNNRIYVEILKEIGYEDGTPESDLIYDFLGFEALVSSYSENKNAEGLTEVSYDLISVGTPSIGKFTAGTEPPQYVDNYTYSDFRDAITHESICNFGPEYTAIQASTPVTAGVLNARYNQLTGSVRLLVSGASHIGVGRTVRLYGLIFSCFSSGAYNTAYFPRPGDPTEFEVLDIIDRPFRQFDVRNATYNHTTGIATLTLSSTTSLRIGDYVSVAGLRFSCLSSGQPEIKEFPQETSHSYFPLLTVTASTITINVGTSTIAHTYVGGGRVQVGPEVRLNVGTAPMEHFYINNGTLTVIGPPEADGTLSYNNADLRPRAGSVFAVTP